MKVLTCPDIHQDLLAMQYCIDRLRFGLVDKVIFLGDVIDSWSAKEWYDDPLHSPKVVLHQLMKWKDEFGDKLNICVGNHDWSYMRLNGLRMDQLRVATGVSGHQWNNDQEISKLFEEADGIFQLAAFVDGVVYSHAGFTNKWLKTYIINKQFDGKRPKSFMKIYEPIVNDAKSLIDSLNKDFAEQTIHHGTLDHCSYSPAGDDPSEGPLWVRPKSLIGDSAFIVQVVGHTELYEARTIKDSKDLKFVVFTDTPTHNACLLITNGNVETMQLHYVQYTDVDLKGWR